MSKKNLGKADYTSIIAAEPLQIDVSTFLWSDVRLYLIGA
jgi:hypothetical protein